MATVQASSLSPADSAEEFEPPEVSVDPVGPPRSGPFSNPVYQELSRINGEINKMPKERLIGKLKQLRLDPRGKVDVLRKRLKSFYRQQKLTQAHLGEKDRGSRCPYKYLCVIDFEATCEQEKIPDYPHEIIEFPAVLVDTREQKIVSEFHEHCRPVINPTLSKFCRTLTGISQEMVDRSDPFPDVLQRFETWLEQEVGRGNAFAFVTDGQWDMGRFLVLQCYASGLPYPSFAKKWINIRKTFSNFYKTKRLSLLVMLDVLELTFEGHQHCGRDDARNIARIVLRMLKDGATLRVNERLNWNGLQQKGARNKANDTAAVDVSRRRQDGPDDGDEEPDGQAEGVSDVRRMLEGLNVDPELVGEEERLLKHCRVES